MINFPPVLVELWQAIGKIVSKLTGFIGKILVFLWHILIVLFDKFVELIKYIADKI